MSQRTLKSASLLSLLLTLILLLTNGFAPTAKSDNSLYGAVKGKQRLQPLQRSVGGEVQSEVVASLTPTAFLPTATPTAVPATLTPSLAPSPTMTLTLTVSPTLRQARVEAAPPTALPVTPVYVPPARPLALTDLCDETQGQVSINWFYSQKLRRRVRYRIYLPPCYAQAGRFFPVLYLFHGLNYGDSQWDSLGLIESLDEGITSGDLPPLMVVMPNAWGIDRDPDGGPGSFEELVVSELLPLVETNYCAWNARQGRAVGGLSRGAFWALEVAFRHPGLFASVGGHSPAVFWDNAPPDYNPYYLADDAPGLESLRIRLDVGEQDWLVKWVARFRERLDERGLEYAFSTAPGDHDDAYWRSQIASYLDFYTSVWPADWSQLPAPTNCLEQPDAPNCRNGLGLGRPCEIALP